MPEVGRGQARVQQPDLGPRAQPGGQVPERLRQLTEGADANAGHPHAVPLVEELPYRLAEHLRHAVDAVRMRQDVNADHLLPRYEPDGMVAARVDDSRDVGPPSRVEDLVGPDDVAVQDGVERILRQASSQVHDRLDARHGHVKQIRVAHVADVPAARVIVGWRTNIEKPEPVAQIMQATTDVPPDRALCPGYQHLHLRPP